MKHDPRDPAPAEEAYRTAIEVRKATRGAAENYQLVAALSLAKLYQSTGRLAEAHAVLAPALEGFSPTPEMPEIAEATALLVTIEAGAHVETRMAPLWTGFRAVLGDAQRCAHGGNAQARYNLARRRCRLLPAISPRRTRSHPGAASEPYAAISSIPPSL